MKNSTRTGIRVILRMLLTAALTALPAAGASYYISPSGDDNSSGDIDHPLRSIQKAADIMNPGDTIYLRKGIHNYRAGGTAFAIAWINRSGTEEKPITFTRYRDPATGLLEHAVIQTFERDDSTTPPSYPRIYATALHVAGSWLKFIDLIIVGSRSTITLEAARALEEKTGKQMTKEQVYRLNNQNGILIMSRDNLVPEHILVEGCEIRENCGSGLGISGYGQARSADYVTVRNNIIHDNNQRNNQGGSAVNIISLKANDGSTATKIVVENNIVYNNENMLIWLRFKKNADGTEQKDANGNPVVYRDTFNGYSDGNGIIVDVSPTYTGRIRISNNIVYNNGAAGICVTKSPNVDIINNTVYRNGHSPYLHWANIAIVGKESKDITVRNNIIWTRDDQWTFHGTKHGENGVVFDGNLYFRDGADQWDPKWGAIPPNSSYGNPQFMDPENGDFRLNPGSSATGIGAVLSAVKTE
ncbi:MAG: right-handed parallel beta-helix repeat-containing protein [Spirochaetes bacterium]|nr:right-handed parallel beta-helix repeat-containing protein [Spirochaetota bacterium]